MSNIKIFVTHTPNKNDYLVENPLLVDVIAGADYQTKPIPQWMERDNNGENISAKNKSYCELSTQYWAWKNVDADYYGFCHYRRFLILAPLDSTMKKLRDDRGQVSSPILNEYTVKKLGLDRYKDMQNYVEQYDCILPIKQDLSKLTTPQGVKKTVYGHFAGHDRMFMHADDLAILMDLIKQLYPDYAKDAQQYMNQAGFWGFNCFVLKKEWFQKLCEFEFGILFELEKKIDMQKYNRQQSRIYGFMGEILSCIFFYHLQKTHPELKFGESQLVYFEYTEKEQPLVPENKETLPIVFHIDRIPPYLFNVTIDSFISSIDANKKYEVIITHYGIEKNFLNAFKNQLLVNENLNVKFYDLTRMEKTVRGIGGEIEDVRLLLPWILQNYNKALVLDWNIIFNSNLSKIMDVTFEDCLIAGVKDVIMEGRALDINPHYEKYLTQKANITSVYDLVNTSVMLMNLKKIRELYAMEQMLHDKKSEVWLNYSEKINALYGGNIRFLKQNWLYYYTENLEEKRLINQVPLSLNNEYTEAEDDACMVVYNRDTMWNQEGSEFCNTYWEKVRKTPYYDLFLVHFSTRNVGNAGGVREPKLTKKIKGGLMCIEDHGLIYTFAYSIRKLLRL